MEKLKISVIIPSRNRVSCLKQLLENINRQTRVPDEVIVIGHVEDLKTRKFLLTLDNKFKFNLKFDFINGGTSKARNRGISLSEGDILVFLDDDVILEKNYIKNVYKIFNNNINIKIITGYTFDLVVLTTPWLVNKGDIEYIWKNKDDDFVKVILNEIKKRHPNKLYIYIKRTNRIYLWTLLKRIRNCLKSVFYLESPIKGKILPSGYRSEFPEITKIEKMGGLVNVEWVQGNNFAARKEVFDKFKFNEKLEKLSDYALNEDLEWSARVLKKYRIYLTSNVKLLHLRAPTGNRIEAFRKLQAMIFSTYIIAKIKWGNLGKLAHIWATIGIILSQFPRYKNIIKLLRELIKIHNHQEE